MTFRVATTDDIDACTVVRMAVTENVLHNPALVPKTAYVDYFTRHGRGWVCEVEGKVVGFSIVGVAQHNVWALFVHPGFENKGIGRRLHDLMMDWYFDQTKETIWLGTDMGSKAEAFYRKIGWTAVGKHGEEETKFEMTTEEWKTKTPSDYERR
jgi:GNAT superfamily N-acetyltransferase